MSVGEKQNPPPTWLKRMLSDPTNVVKAETTGRDVSIESRTIREVARYITTPVWSKVTPEGIVLLSTPGSNPNTPSQPLRHTDSDQRLTPFPRTMGNTTCAVFWLNADFCDPLRELPDRISETMQDDMQLSATAACERLKEKTCVPFEHRLVILPTDFRGEQNRYCAALILASTKEHEESLLQYVHRAIMTEREHAGKEFSLPVQGGENDYSRAYKGPIEKISARNTGNRTPER